MNDIGPLFFLIGLVGGIVSLVLWIWAIVDCVRYESNTTNDKVVWLLLILFLPCLGSLLYFFVRRPQRRRAGLWKVP